MEKKLQMKVLAYSNNFIMDYGSSKCEHFSKHRYPVESTSKYKGNLHCGNSINSQEPNMLLLACIPIVKQGSQRVSSNAKEHAINRKKLFSEFYLPN